MSDRIDDRAFKIVAEQAGVDTADITRETTFVEDLNLDSLDTVELVMAFEDEFKISIPDKDAEEMHSLGQLIDYVAQRA